VLASIAITILLEWLRFVEYPIFIGDFELKGIPGMRMVVFSLALLLIILFRREGLLGMREFRWEWLLGLFRRRSEVK
jgi:branched-chain amino acid transport system permease protein